MQSSLCCWCCSWTLLLSVPALVVVVVEADMVAGVMAGVLGGTVVVGVTGEALEAGVALLLLQHHFLRMLRMALTGLRVTGRILAVQGLSGVEEDVMGFVVGVEVELERQPHLSLLK